LRDPVARARRERRVARVEQGHPQLAAVAGVDEARRVDDRDPVPRGQPRARDDEPGHAGRQRDRHAGPDDAPAGGPQREVLDAREVEPRVVLVRPARGHGGGVQQADLQLRGERLQRDGGHGGPP
jgi:hypothetical protein